MKYIYLILASFLLISCSTTNPVSYSFDTNIGILMHPKFKIYHNQDTLSKVFFQLSTDEVLYTRNNRNQPFKAALTIKYSVFQNNSKTLLDSGSLFIVDEYNSVKSQFIDTSFSFSFDLNQKGYIIFNLVDDNRSRNISKKLFIDKTDFTNKQFFIVRDSLGEPFYSDYFKSNQSIFISSIYHKDKPLYALINNYDFPLPFPPFSKVFLPSFPKSTSASKKLIFDKNNCFKYTFPEEGFVYFQSDTLSSKGFPLFNFNKDYPYVKNISALIPPLRYITTREEYELINNESNPKKAVDKFWLSKASSNERARTLIRTYYSRVQLANELFTSHCEGWRTDRGLISIIFGPPNFVRNNKYQETWIYGNEHNSNTIRFIFEKMENPFSENDYVLKRNYAYKSPWYVAVESWRNGKVYWVQ